MIESVRAFRKKLIGYNPMFFGWPILFAIVVPNLIQPFWFWRLFACFIVGLTVVAISIYGILAPEQIFRDLRSNPEGNKKYVFIFLLTLMWLGAISLAFYLFVIPSSGDLYRTIENPTEAIISQTMEFTKTEHDGGVSPWFMYQRLYTTDQTEYILYFDAQAIGSGTYNVRYSPRTKIIYDISPIK